MPPQDKPLARRGGTASAKPLSAAEAAALLEPLAKYGGLALAVSGGADSMALMTLARRWLDQAAARPEIIVLTVDHGLRPEAAAEARRVAAAAARAGFAHRTLAWTGAKPQAGLQAAARQARYDLMAAFALARGVPAIVTAHHLDDQVETLVMRLARGSGLDGLAAMQAQGAWGGVAILRPLLEVPRARLVASLKAAGVSWIEDPSNANPRYERVAVREKLLAFAGAGVTPAALALSARRLGRARQALETQISQFLDGALTVHPAGYGELALDQFAAAPDEVAIRALARMARTFGGQAAPRLVKTEAAHRMLKSAPPPRFTLGGCLFELTRGVMRVYREAGRVSDAPLVLEPGQTALWDRRFLVAAPRAAPAPVAVLALGVDGLRRARQLAPAALALRWRAARTSPGFWIDGALVAAPLLDAASGEDEPTRAWTAACQARFANWPLANG